MLNSFVISEVILNWNRLQGLISKADDVAAAAAANDDDIITTYSESVSTLL
jgi:hypothetical protein